MRKNTGTRKSRPSRPRSKQKTRAQSVTAHRQSSAKKIETNATHKRALNETTYVFECTRPGCGYRIWRDDKGEEGQHRYDLKCPKCHNQEFKCLGKGDLPETFEITTPNTPLDFDSIKPVDLGTN